MHGQLFLGTNFRLCGADLRVSGIRNLPLAPVLIPPSCDGGDGAGLLFSKLTTCSWEQSSTSVRVYVPLRGVQTSQIQASFEQSSVEVRSRLSGFVSWCIQNFRLNSIDTTRKENRSWYWRQEIVTGGIYGRLSWPCVRR